jgi:hypothetical protein
MEKFAGLDPVSVKQMIFRYKVGVIGLRVADGKALESD